jgi:hypothetical protein
LISCPSPPSTLHIHLFNKSAPFAIHIYNICFYHPFPSHKTHTISSYILPSFPICINTQTNNQQRQRSISNDASDNLQSMVLAAFHKFSLLTTQSTKQQQRQQRSTGNKSLSLESTIFDERDIEILIQNLVAKHVHDNDGFQGVVDDDDDDEAMVRNLEASDSDCGGLAGVLDVVVGQMMLFAGKGDYVIYYYYYYC